MRTKILGFVLSLLLTASLFAGEPKADEHFTVNLNTGKWSLTDCRSGQVWTGPPVNAEVIAGATIDELRHMAFEAAKHFKPKLDFIILGDADARSSGRYTADLGEAKIVFNDPSAGWNNPKLQAIRKRNRPAMEQAIKNKDFKTFERLLKQNDPGASHEDAVSLWKSDISTSR